MKVEATCIRGRGGRVPRGVAVVLAVMMMVLIAGAIAGLTVLFAGEARRTRAAAEGAQLRQLLLAAEPAAGEELLRHGADAREIAVATPVAGASVTLEIAPAGAGGARVQVVAKSMSARASQVLTYVQNGHEWQLGSAILTGQP